MKRECLKDDVSAGDDIAGIILDLDCNESRTKQVCDLLQVEENCQYKVFASNPCFEVWFVAIFMRYVEHTRGLARCWRI